jgi:hypothetical protein
MRFQLHKAIMPVLTAAAFFLDGCSTGDVFLTMNVTEGFVGKRKTEVYIAEITGNDSNIFRQEISTALAVDSNVVLKSYGIIPDSIGSASIDTPGIVVSGEHNVRWNFRTASDEGEGFVTENEHVDEFQYRVVDAASAEELSSGTITHSDVASHNDSHVGFLGMIIGSFVHVFSDMAFSPDAGRRRQTIDDFVRSVTVHTETRNVALYRDEKFPELQEGIDSACSGNWKKALLCFQSAVEKYPEQADLAKAYYNLGIAYECTHEFEKALTALSLANELCPECRAGSEQEYCERLSRVYEWRENYQQ